MTNRHFITQFCSDFSSVQWGRKPVYLDGLVSFSLLDRPRREHKDNQDSSHQDLSLPPYFLPCLLYQVISPAQLPFIQIIIPPTTILFFSEYHCEMMYTSSLSTDSPAPCQLTMRESEYPNSKAQTFIAYCQPMCRQT